MQQQLCRGTDKRDSPSVDARVANKCLFEDRKSMFENYVNNENMFRYTTLIFATANI